jgi:hypothetical protein
LARCDGSRNGRTIHYRSGSGAVSIYSITPCAQHDKIVSSDLLAAL